MPTAEEANRRYFREAYRTGQHGWGAEEPSRYVVDFFRWLKPQARNGAVLDVGCGEGRHAIAAAQLGYRVTAIDYEPLALARARRAAKEKGAAGIRFRQADVFALPFPDAVFDIVLDCGCLHHQKKSDWAAYRRSIVRVLRPGGFYILSVFSPKFRMFRGRRRPWHIAYGAYRRCFTRKDIETLFGGYFTVLEWIEEDGKAGGFWHVLFRRRHSSARREFGDFFPSISRTHA